MEKKELIRKIEKWIKDNALGLTTYSDVCWDDGPIFFKRTDIKAKGDWQQEEWNKLIEDFRENYIDYEEFSEFLKTL